MGLNSSKSEEKTYGYLYAIFGGLSFFAAIILAIYSTYEIHTTTFKNISEKNDATQQALALPLFFTTLAGMFYVLYNLQLQRKTLLAQIESNEQNVIEFKQQVAEAKDSNKHFESQNKTLLNQQADNTFFNLINLNKELNNQLAENNFFIDSKNAVLRHYRPYVIGISTNSFTSLSETIYDPEFYFSIRESEGTTKFRNFATNAKDIIDFVEERLSSQGNFYHKVFYNLLSPPEKFFLGFFVEFELFELKNPSSFDYSAYYKTQLEYTSKFNRFPVHRAVVTPRSFQLANLNETEILLNIITINYDAAAPVILSKVLISVNLQNNDSLVNRMVNCAGTELKDNYDISIKDEIEFIKGLNQTQTLDIVITWQLKYKDVIFTTNSRFKTHYIVNDKITFGPMN